MRQGIVALFGLAALGTSAAGMRRGREFWGTRIVRPHGDGPKRVKLTRQLELGYMIFIAIVIALIAYSIA